MARPTSRQPRGSSYFAGLSRDTFLLGLASLFSDISSEMLYPVLPIFLTQTLHAGGSIVGIVEGVGQAAQNIFQGFSGWLSDRFQRRKPLALAGYVLGAAAKPLIGFAAAWPGVLGARFLDRLGPGIRSAPRDALVASSVDSANRGKAFGLESAGDNTGAFLGPLVAVWLLAAMHVDIRTIFYLAFIPGVLATLTILLVRERPVRMSAKARLDVPIARLPEAYKKYLIVTALFGIGNSSNAFLILRTRESGASLNTTILIYAAFNLVAALSSYPAGYLSDRLGRRDILLLSFVTFLVTYAGFAMTRRLDVIVALFVLYGLYQGIFRSVGKAIATDLVPAHLSASGVGWFGATIGLSGLAASLIAGVMWDRVGHPAVFVFGAASALAGCAALLWLMPSTPRAARATP